MGASWIRVQGKKLIHTTSAVPSSVLQHLQYRCLEVRCSPSKKKHALRTFVNVLTCVPSVRKENSRQRQHLLKLQHDAQAQKGQFTPKMTTLTSHDGRSRCASWSLPTVRLRASSKACWAFHVCHIACRTESQRSQTLLVLTRVRQQQHTS